MTIQTLPNGTLDFLLRLRKIDKRTLVARDVLVLYTIIENPGIDGVSIAHKLGLPDRSSIASHVNRLEREGYIEDRREEHRRANPAIFHALPRGLEFWEEIKP